VRTKGNVFAKCCTFGDKVALKPRHFVVGWGRQRIGYPYPVDLRDSGADLANLYLVTLVTRPARRLASRPVQLVTIAWFTHLIRTPAFPSGEQASESKGLQRNSNKVSHACDGVGSH
jgi:hypothetical protein